MLELFNINEIEDLTTDSKFCSFKFKYRETPVELSRKINYWSVYLNVKINGVSFYYDEPTQKDINIWSEISRLFIKRREQEKNNK
jgi:hypothetical protein